LQVVQSRAEMLDGDDESVAAIRNAAARMDELIDDLLDLSRQGDGLDDVERVELATIVEDAWALVDAADATLETDCPATVEADPARLQQLFENLFRNSIEHAGADVTVSVETFLGGFAVADDGPGIPEEAREAVFEHGYTTEEDGTGYGLQIVADIVEAHGWSVAATESDAGGARFEFTGVEFV
jgi:signal transduction histidine kinase